MELKRRLVALFEVRPAWYTDLLTRIATRLNRTAVEGVLAAGNGMPDFVLPNAEGDLVFSDDLLAQGPLVVSFFRGGWCPFCSATLKALQEVLPDIVAQGANSCRPVAGHRRSYPCNEAIARTPIRITQRRGQRDGFAVRRGLPGAG